MSSNINANNIDGAYPIAGRDNDSQGFRDNFTNIKTNFQAAADEITDLQNKVVLKSALDGTILDNDMGGSVLSNVQFQDTSESYLDLGTPGASQTINYAASQFQQLTLNNNVQINFSNLPASGIAGKLRLQIKVNNTSYRITLPSATYTGVEFIQNYDAATTSIGFPKSVVVYEFEFTTTDNGSTFSVVDLTRNHDPIFLPSKQQLTTSTVDLTKTASYFSPTGSATATLAAGAEGQIKVLAMFDDDSSTATMTVTVTNAAWPSGTVLFNGRGQACTLQYINGKWFCIGNNGASF